MVAPEIDARMNSINEAQEMRVQTSALLCEDLGLKISDSLLILLVSTENAGRSGAIINRQGRTYALLRPRDGEVFQREVNPRRGPCSHLVPLGRKALPSLWALEIQGNGSPTSNC